MIAACNIRPLDLRAVMGRDEWGPPVAYGPAGWQLDRYDGRARVLVSQSHLIPPNVDDAAYLHADMSEWIHASMSWVDRVPTYEEMCRLKRAVWGDNGEAYEVHARKARHVNLQPFVLHLWGRADGAPVLPDFGHFGTI